MLCLKTRWGSLVLFALLIAGCGGSGSPGSEPPVAAEGFLKAATAVEFEASLKAGLTTIESGSAPVRFAAAQNAADSASTTYTAEPRVDEFDSVRYDGDVLYVAPQRFFGCCFIQDGPPTLTSQPPAQRGIRVYRTDPATAGITDIAEIPLEDDVSVQGMYVTGTRLFAITSTTLFGNYGADWAAPAVWFPQRLGYRVYDIADPAAPTEIVRAEADGVFVDSRRIGDTVYLISRYTPSIDGIVLPVQTASDRENNRTVLAGVTLADLLPQVTVGTNSQPLVDSGACFIPNEQSAEVGYPIITTVTAISLTDPSTIRSSCYNGQAFGAYVSEASLYLTAYGATGAADDVQTTRIHKFALASAGLDYRGSGEVPGLVWRGGQADFRMNEAEGRLRVMTSTFTGDSADRFDHELYVLAEDPDVPALTIVGQLPSTQRPAEIGKPNEDLFAVRFVADRAYAVTFERIDPLYVIDLADPTDPVIAGELEVLGFSDFLHPVTDSLLLGIGAAANGALKLELFDVSVLTQPLSRGAIEVGGQGTYSEARHNRYAFAYLAGTIDRFAIPVEEFAEVTIGGQPQWLQAGLYEYEIRDKTLPALASLAEVGRKVVTRADDPAPAPFASRSRSFIVGDSVYFVRDDAVWASRWGDAGTLAGPF